MIRIQPIKNLASVNTGYNFRGAIPEELGGNVCVIQAKDVKTCGYFGDADTLTKTSIDIQRSNSIVKKRDVLLTTRGSGPHRATVNTVGSDRIMASSSLCIIRVTSPELLPQYLALFLNSPEAQSQISQLTSGATILNLTRSNIEKIRVPIPTLEQQKNLIALTENIWRQEEIQKRKIELKRNIINSTLNNIIKRTVK